MVLIQFFQLSHLLVEAGGKGNKGPPYRWWSLEDLEVVHRSSCCNGEQEILPQVHLKETMVELVQVDPQWRWWWWQLVLVVVEQVNLVVELDSSPGGAAATFYTWIITVSAGDSFAGGGGGGTGCGPWNRYKWRWTWWWWWSWRNSRSQHQVQMEQLILVVVVVVEADVQGTKILQVVLVDLE